jgi:phosphomannomutase
VAGIYKAYDIRGIYKTEITVAVAREVGRRLAHMFESGKVVIARDGRHGGPELHEALREGLVSQGESLGKKYDIIDVGLSTTPMFYFLVNHYGAQGGAMVTASHNPKEYSGVKAVRAGAVPISGTEIEAIVLTDN